MTGGRREVPESGDRDMSVTEDLPGPQERLFSLGGSVSLANLVSAPCGSGSFLLTMLIGSITISVSIHICKLPQIQ